MKKDKKDIHDAIHWLRVNQEDCERYANFEESDFSYRYYKDQALEYQQMADWLEELIERRKGDALQSN